ncbi:MAG TPA: UDP-N-acetylmuramoyl-tripeptide--D-alanyl-D-alanine ligase [Gemmatimonadaceae bacterium]
MTHWTLDRVARALSSTRDDFVPRPSGTRALGGISTDTRALARGDVFVALRGERFDGHDYLPDAVRGGASALVVSVPARAAGLGVPVFIVPDTLAALGALGSFWRTTWGGTVIAVAGSNGKTTTKELIRGALSGALEVYATRGNLNNQVGVPLTLLAIPGSASVAVVEVGTSLPGEVDLLRRVVGPDVAVVTSVGEEHLEGLGSVEGVLREETSIYRDVPVGVAPAAQPEIGHAARSLARRVTEAGLNEGTVCPDTWGLDGDGRGWATFGTVRLELHLAGVHNLRNAMLAMAIARACGIPDEIAAAGVSAVEPLAMRGQRISAGGLTILNDAYNANPASMREALALLDGMNGGRPKVVVLGTMRELGPQAPMLHEEIARRALASGADLIAGIGDFAAPLEASPAPRDRIVTAPDVPELWSLLAPRLPRNAIVLIKASRGVRLERLVPLLVSWSGA